MSSVQNNVDIRSGDSLHKWVAIFLALILFLMWMMGYGPGGTYCRTSGPAGGPAALGPQSGPAPAASATLPPATAQAKSAPTPTVPATTDSGKASAATAAAASVAANAPVPPTTSAAANTTGAVTEALPVAKVYFGLDRANPPPDVEQALAGVVAYLQANSTARASIAGFHDPSGDKQYNEALALNRAKAIRNELFRRGIGEARIELQKPSESTGSGDAAQARRVEVSVLKP